MGSNTIKLKRRNSGMFGQGTVKDMLYWVTEFIYSGYIGGDDRIKAYLEAAKTE